MKAPRYNGTKVCSQGRKQEERLHSAKTAHASRISPSPCLRKEAHRTPANQPGARSFCKHVTQTQHIQMGILVKAESDRHPEREPLGPHCS